MSKTIQNGGNKFIISDDLEIDFGSIYEDPAIHTLPKLNKTPLEEINKTNTEEVAKNIGPPIVHLFFSFSNNEKFELAGMLKKYVGHASLYVECECITSLALELISRTINEKPLLNELNIYSGDKAVKQVPNYFLKSFGIIEFKGEVALCKAVFVKKKTI